jgi:hypothetical protein
MASRVEPAKRGGKVLRTQLAGSTRRLAARGEPNQLAARRIIVPFFRHLVSIQTRRSNDPCPQMTRTRLN